MSGFTPVNQVRLTNVATVKLNKRGKRFEIACYRNKVLSWRNKLETDIREVLQIDTVFTNVSKGMLANAKDLQDAFGTTDQKTVCQEILEKGELQVSEQERGALYETIFRDIASIVADKTVNPENNRPYTINMIQNAMRQIQYSVNVSKSSKSQALEVIRKLRDIMPIARASMLIRVISQSTDMPVITAEMEQLGGLITATSPPTSEGSAESFVDLKLDPENFRKVEDFVKAFPGGRSRVEVLQLRIAGAAGVGVGGGAVECKDDFDDLEEEKVEVAKSSKSKKNAPTVSKREEREKEKGIKDDLSALLSQVTGRADFADDSEDDAPVSIAASQSNKKKNKKKKTKNIGTDSDEQSGDEQKETLTKPTASTTMQQAPVSRVKASKKDKRNEKDDKREREQQAKILQERILEEKKRKDEAEKAVAEALAAAQQDANVSGDVTSIEQDQSAAAHTFAVATASAGASASASASAQSCNTCGGAFHDTKAYRDHFRSEWHRFNLKRKLKNLAIIKSEEEFLSLSVSELQI